MLQIGGERRPEEPDTEETPAPAPAPEDEPPSDDEDARTVPAPYAELREKLAAEAARREAIEREVEFLRRGQPVQPAVDPVRQAMDQIRIDPDTWNQMVADPNYGANLATDALQRIFLLNQHLLRNNVLGEVQQQVENRLHQVNIRQDGEQLKRAFWESNQQLLPYDRLVRQFASEVSAEIGQGANYTGDDVLREIRDRTRNELKNYGIAVPDEAPRRRSKVAQMTGRIRPAQAEMGGSLVRGRPQMSEIQKSIYRLARRQA